NELSRLESRKPSSYLQSFIYGYCLWRIGFVKELVYGKPQDVPIHYGHSRDAPVLSAFLDQLVDLVQLRDRTQGKLVRKLLRFVRSVTPEFLPVQAHQLIY